MKELAARRREGRGGRRITISDDHEGYDEYDDEYDDDDDDDDDEDEVVAPARSRSGKRSVREEEEEGRSRGIEYAEYGVSRKEAKAMRDRGSHVGRDNADADAADAWDPGGPAAPLPELESIRLRRQLLETYLLEPFFERVVRGCLVRIGLQGSSASGEPLYRVAEVVGVEDSPDQPPYMLADKRTTKRLRLRFGESTQPYPMSSVSNQPFLEIELRAWQQVLEAFRATPISASQVKAKCSQLQEASHYSYSEADVARRIEEVSKQAEQSGKPVARTARQKLRADVEVAAMKKFKRDGFGKAIVGDHAG